MIKSLFALLLLCSPCLAQSLPAGGGMVYPKSGGGGGTPSVVQSLSTGSAGSSGTLTMASPVTAGNVLVAVIYQNLGTTLTFTDTQGSISAMLAAVDLATDGDRVAVACAPITSTGSDTLTFVSNGTNSAAFAVVYEVQNATCTQDVTAVHTNTTSATACSSGAMTTSTANDFLVGSCGTDTTQATTIAAGSGWSGGLNAGNPSHVGLMSEYRVGTSPGSFTATSGTITSEEQGTLLVALKP